MSLLKRAKFRLLITIFLSIPWATAFVNPPSVKGAVVQLKSGGRFGDNILAFAHALYFAQKNDLKLLYDPFPYSKQLALSDWIQPYFITMDWQFERIVEYPGGPAVLNEYLYQGKNTLFKIPYFPDSPAEFRIHNTWQPFPVDWEDPVFKDALVKLLAPKHKLALTMPPPGKISVAVHIRKGGSFETYLPHDYQKNNGLLTYKIPCEQYYLNQIKNLSDYLCHPPLYVFLFTDDNDPVGMMHRYAAQVNLPNIEFDCRRAGNSHDANVLEDFYSLMKFDCLIRSESNFSIMAEKLANFRIVISPATLRSGASIQDGMANLNGSRRPQRMSSLITAQKQPTL